MKEKISILGPEYSYCHILAKRVFPNSDFLFCNNIELIFDNVQSGVTKKGLAPFENMINGSVRESILSLNKHKTMINSCYDLPIHHCLAAKSSKFNKIASHPQALAQSSKFLEQFRKNGFEIIETPSTSKAMSLASEDETIAAIGSEDAALANNLRIIEKGIENEKNNVTRFIEISKKETKENKSNLTSLLVHPKKDFPGLLYEILGIFDKNKINLTKIESIPSGKKLGDYLFYLEIEGNLQQDNVKKAMQLLNKIHPIHILGSYSLIKI